MSLHRNRLRREHKVRIGILGTGGVGAALGIKWASAGHEVAFGSRTPDSAKSQELAAKTNSVAKIVPLQYAVDHAEVLLVAIPWLALQETLLSIGPCAGKIIIDCVNPLLPDLSGLAIESGSTADVVAAALPTARVVKAFNTASTKVMKDPAFPSGPATMFYCGDDVDAKAIVDQLVSDIGFQPVDAGPLANARHLESLAMLYIHLAFKGGWGSNCAFQMVKR